MIDYLKNKFIQTELVSNNQTSTSPSPLLIDHKVYRLYDMLPSGACMSNVFLGFTSDGNYLVSIESISVNKYIKIQFWEIIDNEKSNGSLKLNAKLQLCSFVKFDYSIDIMRNDHLCMRLTNIISNDEQIDDAYHAIEYFENYSGNLFCLIIHAEPAFFLLGKTPRGIQWEAMKLNKIIDLHSYNELPLAQGEFKNSRIHVWNSLKEKEGFTLGIYELSMPYNVTLLHFYLTTKLAIEMGCFYPRCGSHLTRLSSVPLSRDVIVSNCCFNCYGDDDESNSTLSSFKNKFCEICHQHCPELKIDSLSHADDGNMLNNFGCISCQRLQINGKNYEEINVNFLESVLTPPPLTSTIAASSTSDLQQQLNNEIVTCQNIQSIELAINQNKILSSCFLTNLPQQYSCSPLPWACALKYQQTNYKIYYFTHARYAHFYPSWQSVNVPELIGMVHQGYEVYTEHEGFVNDYSKDNDDVFVTEELLINNVGTSSASTSSVKTPPRTNTNSFQPDETFITLTLQNALLFKRDNEFVKFDIGTGREFIISEQIFCNLRKQCCLPLYSLNNFNNMEESIKFFQDPLRRITISR